MAEGNSGGGSFSGVAGVIAGVAALITAATGAWMAFNGVNRPAPAAAVAVQPQVAPVTVQPVPVTATIVVQPAPMSATGVTAAMPPPAPVVQPGFDCSRAANRVETMICGDPGLAGQDREMLQVYRQAMAVARTGGWDQSLRASQRQWLALRNACDAASDPQDCVAQAYSARIGQLRGEL